MTNKSVTRTEINPEKDTETLRLLEKRGEKAIKTFAEKINVPMIWHTFYVPFSYINF